MTAPTDFYFGCYWGDRGESPADCAQRILAVTSRLANIDQRFGHWEVVLSTQAGTPLMHDPHDLGLLLESVNPSRAAAPFVVSLVSQAHGEEVGASLRVACGGCAGVSGIVNSVVLKPIYSGYGHTPWLLNAKDILSMAAQSFEADWGALLTPEYRIGQSNRPRVPIVGALTFLADWRGKPPSGLPVDRVDHGWLIDLLGETVALPGVEEVLRVQRILDTAGLLQPTPLG